VVPRLILARKDIIIYGIVSEADLSAAVEKLAERESGA
jgi:hypothetical protein